MDRFPDAEKSLALVRSPLFSTVCPIEMEGMDKEIGIA